MPRFDPTAVGLVLVIFATEAVIGVLLLAVNPGYPVDRLHAGVSFTGLAISVYGASKMPGQPLGGWLADRFQPRLVLLTGLGLSIPVIGLMSRVGDVWLYMATWACFGFSLAVVWPTVYAIVGQRFRASLQGRLLAVVSMGQIAGTAAGTGVGATLVDHVSYTAAFGIALVTEGAALLLTVAFVRGGAARTRAPASSEPSEVRSRLSALAGLLSLNVSLLIAIIMLVSVSVAMLTPDLKPYSEQVLHLRYSSFVLLLVPPAAIAAALLVPAGWVADRFGRNTPMLIGLALFSASLSAITLVRTPVLASALASVAAIGYILILPALSASLIDLSTAGNRGLVTGVSTSIQAIGLVVGPPIGGVLADASGALAPFRAASAVVAGTFVLALFYASRTRHVYRERVLDAAAPATATALDEDSTLTSPQ